MLFFFFVLSVEIRNVYTMTKCETGPHLTHTFED